MARTFRTQESYAAERATRRMIVRFLEERGFRDVHDERKSHGPAESQVLRAIDEAGRRVALWVRLCWRQSDGRQRSHYSAAQLLAKVKNNDWVGSIRTRLDRARADGITDLLLVQRVGSRISYAAAIPLAAVIPIWTAQRDRSAALIRQGKLGRRTKNHAMNGSSPTLWLRSEVAPSVAKILWNYRGVRDLAQLSVKPVRTASDFFDDSMDDLPGLDYAAIGSDGAGRVERTTSGVKRDPKVRKAVAKRSRGECEREGCQTQRSYTGFFDVHHILGASKGDRVWNCVALCPNCHREAHAAPNRNQINAILLKFAAKYRPARAK
jgi:5-methylcytosine-specific restriction protein A